MFTGSKKFSGERFILQMFSFAWKKKAQKLAYSLNVGHHAYHTSIQGVKTGGLKGKRSLDYVLSFKPAWAS